MKNGIQNMFYALGISGCYALCLIDIAEEFTGREMDAAAELEKAIGKGYVTYHWENWSHPDNFFVTYPGLFLEQMTGRKWEVRYGPAGKEAAEGEYIVRRYEYVKTGQTSAHFERDRFKPYLNSRTVRYGEEASVRVCKVLN